MSHTTAHGGSIDSSTLAAWDLRRGAEGTRSVLLIAHRSNAWSLRRCGPDMRCLFNLEYSNISVVTLAERARAALGSVTPAGVRLARGRESTLQRARWTRRGFCPEPGKQSSQARGAGARAILVRRQVPAQHGRLLAGWHGGATTLRARPHRVLTRKGREPPFGLRLRSPPDRG